MSLMIEELVKIFRLVAEASKINFQLNVAMGVGFLGIENHQEK